VRGHADLSQNAQAPQGPVETFAGKTLAPEDYQEVEIDTKITAASFFAWVIAPAALSPSAKYRPAARTAQHRDLRQQGRCRLEPGAPDELWIGHRNTPNQIIIKDPSLLKEAARPYADLPAATAKVTTIPSSRSSAASTNRLTIPPPSPNTAVRRRSPPIADPRSRARQRRSPRLG